MKTWYWFVITVLFVVGCRNDLNEKEQYSSLCKRIQNAINQGVDLNAMLKDENDYYAYLHIAALTGDVEAARLLLDHKADIDVKDRIGATPLHRAVQNGHIAVARLLVEKGANLNACSNSKSTPLFFAAGAESNSKESIQLLVCNGANVNAIDEMGTALHWAAFHGNDIAVELLLDNGADIGARDYRGYTPLHTAALYGCPSVAEVLLKRGADPEAPSESGRPIYVAMYETVPDHVSESGKKQVAKLIQEYIDKAKSSKQ